MNHVAFVNEGTKYLLSNFCFIHICQCRKQKDLYLWTVKCPSGPSVKFLVNAVHTMEELKLTGNHLKGSRPILIFSSNFDKEPRWKLIKEMIVQACFIFGTPKAHRKVKPFHDHVFVFSIVDGHIWFQLPGNTL
ncbi:ribosome biogenesis protein BRX1 [Musa troglodytarum]|uniref:Ribosome biogenesis protein BRX1 n=1 Tax=Musa troglodytarum TaxID=320322 RepID=A0A9E7FKQ7_9LILI|nr:ribosome biogenesis protein BRX1 [Musa troglodytarum]